MAPCRGFSYKRFGWKDDLLFRIWTIQVLGLLPDTTFRGMAGLTSSNEFQLSRFNESLEGVHMKSSRVLDEIRETNLSYLLLAQQLIREDRAEALIRLGISEEVADLVDQLSTSQVMRIASSNMLMCRFRFDDQIVWNLLTSHTKDRSAQGMHASILMAGKAIETADLGQ